MAKIGSFDRWTWEKCKDVLSTLPGRLGFPKSDTLQFLDLEVSLKDGSITDLTLGKSFDPKIEYVFFLLHQYAKAEETPLTHDYISYKQISGGRVYSAVFEGRAVKPIENLLASTPELFKMAAERLNGVSAKIGDLAFTIAGLPLVPYTYAIWESDEEFPARAKVFLDRSAAAYLDAEAHAHLASLVTYRLLAIARTLG
ncbi:MAG: DUF3786 domain-containing protein [Promethearchaeota archaeon]